MARMTGKTGVAMTSSVEQATPRVRPVVALGSEKINDAAGWGRSIHGMGGVLCTGWGGGGSEGLEGRFRYPCPVWSRWGAVGV
eukprot:950204-Prymnesium_polylepis.1